MVIQILLPKLCSIFISGLFNIRMIGPTESIILSDINRKKLLQAIQEWCGKLRHNLQLFFNFFSWEIYPFYPYFFEK